MINYWDRKKGVLNFLILWLFIWLFIANINSRQFVINGIIAGCIYALIAMGFCIIYKTIEFFNFAHGIVYTAGAYLTYTFCILFKINPIISILLSIFIAALLGIIINRLVYYRIRRKRASNLVLLLTSFGVFIFLQNLLQLIFGAQILTLRTGPIKEGYNIMGAIITNNQILIIIASLGIFFLTWMLVQKMKIGKAIRAVADDSIGARVSGINSEKIITAVFAIGSALAGVAGILASLETNIEPTMGFNAILKGIIASIIGGVGSIPGALLGGLFLGLAENLGIWQIQAGWKDAIAFGILILFLLFRPSGIMNVKPEKEKV
jgi:branched-chain amino acid transport system permease protein